MCLLHIGSALAASVAPRQVSASDGYLCGHVTPAAVAALVETVPQAFADAYRQMTGAGEDCCGLCADCGAAVPRTAAAILRVAATSPDTPLLPVSRGAFQPEVLTPPSTAPPALS